jgi:hypothetical protein
MVASRPESEWDDREQALVLAMAAYKAGLCDLCGSPIEECTDPMNEGKYKPEGPIRCHKTTAIAVAGKKIDPKVPHPEALMIGASLRV